MKIGIINGANLNLTGKRQTEIYGHQTLADLESVIKEAFPELDVEMVQSNTEGVLIDAIQRLGYDSECVGLVINPGAYAHYSYAIADALRSVPVTSIEVHLSNIHAREVFRHESVTAAACKGMICGFGFDGYLMAVKNILNTTVR